MAWICPKSKTAKTGLGVHFVPSNVTFKDAPLGNMWKRFRKAGAVDWEEFENEFSVTFRFR